MEKQKDIENIKREINELKEDIELIKLSLILAGDINASIDRFKDGRYGSRDKAYFDQCWSYNKLSAQRFSIIKKEGDKSGTNE